MFGCGPHKTGYKCFTCDWAVSLSDETCPNCGVGFGKVGQYGHNPPTKVDEKKIQLSRFWTFVISMNLMCLALFFTAVAFNHGWFKPRPKLGNPPDRGSAIVEAQNK